MSKKDYILKYLLVVCLVVLLPGPVSALVITDSANVTITAIVGSSTNPPNNGSGGGDYTFRTTVNFLGLAYPGATVHVWKNGVSKSSMVADDDGVFSIDIDEPYSDSALYTLYAIDKNFQQSLLLNYPIAIKNKYYTQVSGVRFAPTISTDKTEVKIGSFITVAGYALPNANIEIHITGAGMIINKSYVIKSKADGTYSTTSILANFPKGDYAVKVNYPEDKRSSKIVKFTIGEVDLSSVESLKNIPGDCNADQVINIVDFSILAYWYGKPNPPRCVDTNNDKIINLVDFSIIAFYWTG